MSEAIGRFSVVRRLGEGGMGYVVAAHDPRLDRLVALKVLHADIAARLGSERLVREARAMARVSHPNVVAVYEVDSVDGLVYVAMEHVDGETVRQWAERDKPGPREVVEVFLAAGEGLAAVHAAGLVHRDFKPRNVMLGRDGRVRVLDFGLAWTPADRATGTVEARAGTPVYMAPEQHRGAEQTARADQFAFCVSLHQCVYGGALPFPGSTPEAIAHSIVRGVRARPPAARRIAWIDRVVDRGLAPRPDERFPDMRALLDELRADPELERARVEDAARLLAGVWDDGKKRAVRDAFVASGRTDADEEFERLRELLDEFAGASVRAPVGGDRRLGALRALVDGIAGRPSTPDGIAGRPSTPDGVARVPNTGVVDHAVAAAFRLGGAESMTETAGDAATRDALRDVRAAYQLGRYREAIALTTAIAGRATTAARAHALYWRASASERLVLAGDARADLHECLQLAARTRDDALTARAFVRLLIVVGYRQRLLGEAQALLPAAEAAAVRAGVSGELRAELLAARAQLAWLTGDLDRALADHEAALELRLAAHGSNHPEVARSLRYLGAALRDRGRLDDAREHYERALATYCATLGDHHPETATALANLGHLHVLLGDGARARGLLEQARAIRARALGDDHPDVALVVHGLGAAAEREGRFTDALEAHERALDGLRVGLGDDHPLVASALTAVGRCHLALGHLDRAAEPLTRALAIRDDDEARDLLARARGGRS